jgi:galactose-1-phosphate uridylyltransferase
MRPRTRQSWLLTTGKFASQRGQQESPSKTTLPHHDPECYLCPGNKRAQGDVNPKYESTFVFVNDYSAVKEEQAAYDGANGDGTAQLRRSFRPAQQRTNRM